MSTKKVKQSDRSKAGFVLVTTMFFMVITVMLVSAALKLLPSTTLMTGTVSGHSQATLAAQAGIEYARTRLQENPSWRGGDADAITVNLKGQMWVRESKGNVVGILWSPSGEASLFKIRFNHQNKDKKPDEGLTDPPSQMKVDSIYVSNNNLSGPSAVKLYRANPTTFKVNSGTSLEVPKYAAVVYSEGYAGPAVQGVSPSNLLFDSSTRRLSHLTAEVYLGRDVSKYGDSVLYGARDVSVDIMKEFRVESSDDATPPRARSMGDITVSGVGTNPLTMENGEVYVKPGDGKFTINSVESTNPVASKVDSSAQFLKLGWDEIDKATTSDAQLPAGTYVWRTGGALDYYAQDFNPAVGIPPTPPDATYNSTIDLPPSVSGAVALTPGGLEITFKKDVLIQRNGSATGLTITSEPGLVSSLGRRPQAVLEPPDPNDPSPILTMSGPFRLEGRIRGDGSITSEDDITFQGESVLEAKKDNKVAIYSKKDINVEPIPPGILAEILSPPAQVGQASATPGPIVDFFREGDAPFGLANPNDVAFGGVIYAQGNFNVDVGSDSNFHLHGIMVAYGGDSALGESPGDRAGAGYVHVKAKNAQLMYDSSYVANLLDQNGATKLDVISWRQR